MLFLLQLFHIIVWNELFWYLQSCLLCFKLPWVFVIFCAS
jgi:hypothetical protein